MRVPDRLSPLLDAGVLDDVVRPLMSGKEAAVFLVVMQGWPAVAKVYKDAEHRSFRQRAAYTEGRKVRNTRQQRAMQKRTSFGREEEEAAWRNAEVDAIYRLRAANVRVPEPYAYEDGVLVMELVTDADGEPAPRLVDASFTPAEARQVFGVLLREVVKMLCAGVVHGDLSDFNVLLGRDGPVIIDFPQWADPASNNNAREMLIRDVKNLTSFLARHDPELKGTQYGEEMWSLYQSNKLLPDTVLTGRFRGSNRKADTNSILEEIAAAEREAAARREALGLPPRRTARKPVVHEGPPPKPINAGKRAPKPAAPRAPEPARTARAEPENELDAWLIVEDDAPRPPKGSRRDRG